MRIFVLSALMGIALAAKLPPTLYGAPNGGSHGDSAFGTVSGSSGAVGNGFGGTESGFGPTDNVAGFTGNDFGPSGNGFGDTANGARPSGNSFVASGSNLVASGNGFEGQTNAYGQEGEVVALGESIPGGGVPGEDYPILASVPDTGFSCDDQAVQGYYADTAPEAGCQVFHICQDRALTRQQDSFLCPNGTIFNQQYLVCDWWFNVDCSQAESFYSVNELTEVKPSAGYTSSGANGNGNGSGNDNRRSSGNGSRGTGNGRGSHGNGNGFGSGGNGGFGGIVSGADGSSGSGSDGNGYEYNGNGINGAGLGGGFGGHGIGVGNGIVTGSGSAVSPSVLYGAPF